MSSEFMDFRRQSPAKLGLPTARFSQFHHQQADLGTQHSQLVDIIWFHEHRRTIQQLVKLVQSDSYPHNVDFDADGVNEMLCDKVSEHWRSGPSVGCFNHFAHQFLPACIAFDVGDAKWRQAMRARAMRVPLQHELVEEIHSLQMRPPELTLFKDPCKNPSEDNACSALAVA